MVKIESLKNGDLFRFEHDKNEYLFIEHGKNAMLGEMICWNLSIDKEVRIMTFEKEVELLHREYEAEISEEQR